MVFYLKDTCLIEVAKTLPFCLMCWADPVAISHSQSPEVILHPFGQNTKYVPGLIYERNRV